MGRYANDWLDFIPSFAFPLKDFWVVEANDRYTAEIVKGVMNVGYSRYSLAKA